MRPHHHRCRYRSGSLGAPPQAAKGHRRGMKPGLPRLLIAGAGGFLGGYLNALGSVRFECLPAGRSAAAIRLDITDAASVRSVFRQTRPDVVALVAALSDIDDCERRPAIARVTNVV